MLGAIHRKLRVWRVTISQPERAVVFTTAAFPWKWAARILILRCGPSRLREQL
jgi:hypothetical protein